MESASWKKAPKRRAEAARRATAVSFENMYARLGAPASIRTVKTSPMMTLRAMMPLMASRDSATCFSPHKLPTRIEAAMESAAGVAKNNIMQLKATWWAATAVTVVVLIKMVMTEATRYSDVIPKATGSPSLKNCFMV